MIIDDSYKTKGNIPDELRGAFVRYIEQGIQPGSFISAALENDFCAACTHADTQNRFVLYDVAIYIYNYVPSVAWGDRRAIAAWMAHRGLAGWPEEHRAPKVEVPT